MWPWGHLAAAYLLYAGFLRLRGRSAPGEIAVLLVLIGSLFPDLVDKPFSWYLGVLPTGRSLAHSLVVLLPVCAGVYLVARQWNRRSGGIAFGIGALSHLLVDALPGLWRDDASVSFLLYPLVPVEPYPEGPPSILGLLQASMSDPYFLFEFVLVAAALWVWRLHGYPGWRPVPRVLVRQ